MASRLALDELILVRIQVEKRTHRMAIVSARTPDTTCDRVANRVGRPPSGVRPTASNNWYEEDGNPPVSGTGNTEFDSRVPDLVDVVDRYHACFGNK
jgi:hypothetical protein